MIEGLGELIVDAVVALCRWLWRLAFHRRGPASSVGPAAPAPQAFTPAPRALQSPGGPRGTGSVPDYGSVVPSLTPPPSKHGKRRHRTGGLRPPGSGGAFEIPAHMPYRRAKGLLTKGERAFWFPLFKAVEGKYRLFCKVRLGDVVVAPPGRRDEQRWFRKIRGYHVDFVLCDPKSTAPLLVVELDDRSHGSRSERDAFKDAVLAAAGLPVYRVPTQQAYDPIELRETIERLIGAATS